MDSNIQPTISPSSAIPEAALQMMPAPALPPEVAYDILDILVDDDDLEALCCCSLVCHKWRLYTQPILFKTLEIHGHRFKERLFKCLIYGSSTHSSYIRFLTLNTFLDDNIDDNPVAAHHIGLLIRNLPLLQSLVLRNVKITTAKPSKSQQGIPMLTLEELKLHYGHFEMGIVTGLLTQFASIDRLVIQCYERSGREFMGLKDAQTSVPTGPRVSSLDLVTIESIALALSKFLGPTLSTLKTLSIVPDWTNEIDAIHIGAVIRGTNPGLESFVVDISPCLSHIGKELHPNLS